MTYTRENYQDVESVGDGMHFMRGELEAENLGFTVIDVEEGWTGKEHDHSSDQQEEIYYLASGRADLVMEDEVLVLEPGDAVRVSPEESRKLTAREDSVIVVAGAP